MFPHRELKLLRFIMVSQSPCLSNQKHDAARLSRFNRIFRYGRIIGGLPNNDKVCCFLQSWSWFSVWNALNFYSLIMGIYLSTPSTDIALEEGKGSKVKYVVGEMQVRGCHLASPCDLNGASTTPFELELYA